MAFFKKLMDHILNKVLVETLANSRWFQRFAVHTHKLSKEMAEKGKCSVSALFDYKPGLSSFAMQRVC